MGSLSEHLLNFEEFCLKTKEHVFCYEKVEPIKLLEIYDKMVDKAEYADKMAQKLMLSLGMSEDELSKFHEKIYENPPPEIVEKIKSGTVDFIIDGFKDCRFNIDGYCLKENLIGTAVQMTSNENMLGFITDTVEGSTRFVMVDFGEADGPLKIDIDELILG